MRTRSSRSRIARTVAAATLLAAILPTRGIWAQGAAAPAADASASPQVFCQPQVIGNRRIPKESVLARMATHQGDPYDPATVERDFNAIWNTGFFENVRIERVDTPTCVQMVVYVLEKPTIRTIDYTGLNSVTLSDVDERLKKAKAASRPRASTTLRESSGLRMC